MLPAFLLSLALAVHAVPVAALPADHPLVAAWADTPVAATWFFVFETAGRSLPAAEAAREDIARLIEALPEGDHVKVLALHTRTNLALAATVGDAAARAGLAAEVRALKLPSAKDSDLGAGLAEVSARVGKTDPRSPRIVWMMESFCHSPSVSSGYADGGAGCRTIRGFEGLDRAFDSQPGGASVDVVLFPTTAGQSTTGQAAVERFFGPKASVRVAPASLADWVAATRADVALARVRPLAHAEASDLSLEVSVRRGPSPDSPEALLTLATGLSHLTFRATHVEVAGGTTRLAALQLAPDGQLAVEVAVPPRTFSLFPAREPLALPVTVTLSGLLGPTDALRAAGIPPETGRADLDRHGARGALLRPLLGAERRGVGVRLAPHRSGHPDAPAAAKGSARRHAHLEAKRRAAAHDRDQGARRSRDRGPRGRATRPRPCRHGGARASN